MRGDPGIGRPSASTQRVAAQPPSAVGPNPTHSRHKNLGMTNVRSQRRCRHSETEDVRQGLGRRRPSPSQHKASQWPLWGA
jgi:hypothetical protein